MSDISNKGVPAKQGIPSQQTSNAAPTGAVQQNHPSQKKPQLNARLRPDRKPLNRRVVLGGSASSEDFVPRWVRNTPERIAQVREAGYEFVRTEQNTGEGYNVGEPSQLGNSVIVRKAADGDLVLMEIRKDFYAEDRENDAVQLKELETEITKPNASKGREKVYEETQVSPKPANNDGL